MENKFTNKTQNENIKNNNNGSTSAGFLLSTNGFGLATKVILK